MTPEDFFDRFILSLENLKDTYQLDTLHDALILWVGENCISLDPDDVRDRIVKDSHAEGVDAVLIDSLQRVLIFVQAKAADTFTSTSNNYSETDLKNTLEGVRFLLRSNYKGHITPKLENLVDEYHELDRTFDYKTIVLFVSLKDKPVAYKFVEAFKEDFPQVDVYFWDFDWLFTFYRDNYLARTDPPPDLVSFKMLTKSLTKTIPHESKVFTCRGEELARIYDENGEKIFQQNVRHSLGLRSKSINRQILETAKSQERGKDFWYFNNGITIVCTKISETTAGNVIKLHNPQIINGAQTTYALHEAYKNNELQDDIEILVKAIQTEDKDFAESVTLYTNSQNAIRLRDLCSNDEIQRRIQRILLDSYQYFYERKRGEFDTLHPTTAAKRSVLGDDYKARVLTNENAAQAFLAIYLGKPSQAKAQKGAIFSKDEAGFYYQIFDEQDDLLPEKLLVSWKLLKFVEARKASYKKEYDAAEGLTDDQQAQVYRYDFVLHSEYFMLNLLKDFLEDRGFEIENNRDHLSRILTEIDSGEGPIQNCYETIRNELSEYMGELKWQQGYYHNKFFKSEKSIGLVRNFFRKKHEFIQLIQ